MGESFFKKGPQFIRAAQRTNEGVQLSGFLGNLGFDQKYISNRVIVGIPVYISELKYLLILYLIFEIMKAECRIIICRE